MDPHLFLADLAENPHRLSDLATWLWADERMQRWADDRLVVPRHGSSPCADRVVAQACQESAQG